MLWVNLNHLFNLDLGLVEYICTEINSFILDFPVWWNINVFLLKMVDFMVYGCFAHIYMSVYHMWPGIPGRWNRVLESLEIKLQTVVGTMWLMWMELRYSGKALSAHNPSHLSILRIQIVKVYFNILWFSLVSVIMPSFSSLIQVRCSLSFG